MTVSEYVFDFIQRHGCKTVYMVSGSSAMWLTDALKRNKGLSAVCCHHEQAAAMAADGYGRVHDVPGTCLVTIGPGATNAVTGVAQAYVDSSPMIVISGQANSRLLKYECDTGIRQHGTQSLNLEPLVSSVTKYFVAVMHPEEIRYCMERAYYEALHGRKGPVWIDIPVDIQNKQIPDEINGYTGDEEKRIFTQDDMRDVTEHLLSAKKPLILAGNGIRSAGAENLFLDFAETYNIPVVTSRGGIDVIHTAHRLFVGRPGNYGDRASHYAIQQCDLLLILGSRLSVSTIGYYPERFGKNAYKIMVDIDDKELEKPDVPVDKKICGDLRAFLKQLLLHLEGIDFTETNAEWIKKCQEWKMAFPNVVPSYSTEKPLNSYYFTKVLSGLIPEKANIVVDTGSVCNIVSQSFELKKGQRYLISGGLSCMGFWATAIGAHEKDKIIIALTGDGSAQMNIQELATLKYNRLPIKLFIYDNHGYMLIRHNQHNYMDDRFLGVGPDSGLETPDFVKVAEAYEIHAVRITAEDDLEAKLREILDYTGPVVCQVEVQEFAPIIPRIASKVMADGSLRAAEFDDLYPFIEQ